MILSDQISAWIKKEVNKSNKKGVVLGISGGVDSAVVAGLSKKALGDNVLGLILPCQTGNRELELAREVAAKFNVKTKEIALDDIFEAFVKINPDASALARANIKPRVRMVTFYYFANSMDYLVAGTGNKSEIAIGYFTKHGDGGSDILPLASLLKTEVRKLAKEMGVPKAVIETPPSAGLWKGQTDEGEIGITYDELDRVIIAIEKKKTKGINKKTLEKIKKMINNSAHKRCAAPVFKKGGKG